MICVLLLLALSAVLVLWLSNFLFAAARFEERENMCYLGAKSGDYMKCSKMFMSWIV